MEEGDLRRCCGGGGSSSSNDWDLHAVVCFATCSCSGGSRIVASPRASDKSLFSCSGVPLLVPPQSQQNEATDAAVLPQLPIGGGPAVDDFWGNDRSIPQPRNQEAPPQQPPTPKPRASYCNNDGAGGGGLTRSKRKKKKSQVTNKEVTRVPVGAPPLDPWAWRKYGQKPIKGSPYPRGYYRCSTDKDCRARKQVERCCIDPSTLIVRYSGGEHSHPVPLHRSAVAGSTRNKPQVDPAAVSSSPIEDAEMEFEDVLSFLKPTPPSPTDGSGSKDDVTQLRHELPIPGTSSSSKTADSSWAAAPAARNVNEIEMCPFGGLTP